MLNVEKVFQDKKSFLITGETGVGKTIAVNKLHQKYSKHKPLVSINVSGIPDQFFESELYGYKKGAFTGAINSREGLLKKAGNGIVFLDEIGDLSSTAQLKMLKLIDEKTYYPIGEDSPNYFHGHFIFATHKNLKVLVDKGHFREDLYYRISGLVYEIKPLRERRSIITQKLRSYESKLSSQYFQYLCTEYDWPGNIRELVNLIERLEYELVVEKLDFRNEMLKKNNLYQINNGIDQDSYYAALAVFEREFLQRKMEKFKGRLNQASEKLGLSKSTLIAKLRKYGINNLEIKAMSQKSLAVSSHNAA
jgi:transcriptional regulator with PAS, ATPase and Fis domain